MISRGAPTVGDSDRSPTATITRNFTFLTIRAYVSLKKQFPNRHPGGSHFRKNVDFEGRRRWRGEVRFPPIAIATVFAFPLYLFTGILKSNSTSRHFRRVAFWPKTSILRERRRRAGFTQTPHPLQSRGFPLFQFRGFTEFLESNSPNRRAR